MQQSNQGCKRIWSRLVRRPEKCPHRPTGGGVSPHDFHHDSSPRPDSFTLACAVLLSQFFHVKKSIPSLRKAQNEVKCSNFIGWKKYRVVRLVTEIGKRFCYCSCPAAPLVSGISQFDVNKTFSVTKTKHPVFHVVLLRIGQKKMAWKLDTRGFPYTSTSRKL